ncbi:MAG: hypothetical protein JEZ12_23710 [Desulfobacterium sp.]|nr:hypothetical protein [Desulfobacterium sp.]
MKKIVFAVVGLVAMIIIAGIIRFNFTNDDIYVSNKDGKMVKYDAAEQDGMAYSSEVMLTLFSMRTANDLMVNVPETGSTCKLTDLAETGRLKVAKGSYTAGEERGVVMLDYMKITTVNLADSMSQIYFVAPFAVSNQGSGVFYYMGVFVQDVENMSITHVDSFFLGDRVVVENISSLCNEVHVEIKAHSEDQAMAETPADRIELKIKVGLKGFIR